MSAASTSNPSCIVEVGEHYPYPSHAIAPNFVTVKLSGRNKYNMWKTQMLCLLESHHMFGFINGQFPCPEGSTGKGKVGDMEAWVASNSLVKGWILGSLSEEAFNKVVNHLTHKQKKTFFTAKDLWDELQRIYGPSVREQGAETILMTRQAESVIEVISVSEDAKSKDEQTEQKIRKEKIDEMLAEDIHKRWLYTAIIKGYTTSVIDALEERGLTPLDKITNNGNTVLHVAVGSSDKNHELIKRLLGMIPKEHTLVDLINSDESTLVHVAVISGNTALIHHLVKRNPDFLSAKDKEGHTPLALSISSMHTEISHLLFEHVKVHGYGHLFSGQSGEDLVVLAISCQDIFLALRIIDDYPYAILSDSDAVLTALAQNFPRELKFWERRGLMKEFDRITSSHVPIIRRLYHCLDWSCGRQLFEIFHFFYFVLCMVAAMFCVFFKVFVRLFSDDKFQIHEDATKLLFRVCNEISMKGNLSTYHQYYNNSIFEATRRNATTFIRFIMKRFPDAIRITNEDGHDFIQYSVINRSEKIYNLLYEMSEHMNIYKTIKDSSGNNLLHLAARLAPTNKLNLISGAALQIQRELQWFKEVERFVCLLNRTQKNADGETPEMVFTREHKDLVIEGEIWIKKTAESYTITAALIITIVFAAAITVPGGNNQDSGIPIFTTNIAFTIFAISDAVSLFTAVTSLLMFLSILTARFAEQDFLLKLPTKLIIGLTMLFLSTTAMIIAFGATLFLVFGQSNLLMLIPIGALTCLPITSFVTLQFPLIVELISATYCSGIFVKEKYEYFY